MGVLPLKRYNFKIKTKMSKEKKPLSKQEYSNDIIADVKKSFPLIEGKTKTNIKKYNGIGKQAPPPPPLKTIKDNDFIRVGYMCCTPNH